MSFQGKKLFDITSKTRDLHNCAIFSSAWEQMTENPRDFQSVCATPTQVRLHSNVLPYKRRTFIVSRPNTILQEELSWSWVKWIEILMTREDDAIMRKLQKKDSEMNGIARNDMLITVHPIEKQRPKNRALLPAWPKNRSLADNARMEFHMRIT